MDESIDFQALFEAGPAAFLVLAPNPEFRMLAVSDAYLGVCHRTRNELLGQPLFAVFPDDPSDEAADSRTNLSSSLTRVLRTGKSDALPLRKYSTDKSEQPGNFHARYWSVVNSPVFNSEGDLLYILHRVEEVPQVLLQNDGSEVSQLTAEELHTALVSRVRDLADANHRLTSVNQSLTVSENRFRRISETGTFGLMICDLEGQVRYLNPALQRLLGYTEQEVAEGLVRWDKMTPAKFRDLDAKGLRELHECGTCTPFEKVYIAKDGRPVPVLVGASMLESKDGMSQVVAFILDLTDRVSAQEQLRSSEARNRTVIESLPQLVWTCHCDGACTYLSPQWVSYTGMPEKEQLGLRWLDLVMHPEDRSRTYQAWMSAVQGDAVYDLEYRLRRHDGVYRWFKTRGVPILGEGGEITEWFGTCTDIDDQIRSEQQLRLAIHERESQWREFNTALSNTSDLTYSFDLNGRFTYANQALLTLLQRSLIEVVGRDFLELDYPAELAETLQQQIQSVVRSGNPLRADTPFTDPFGAIRHYEYILVPVIAGNRVESVTGSTRDITDRKKAEETLRESEQRLRFALQSGRMNSWEYGPLLTERHAGAGAKGIFGLMEVWNAETLIRILPTEELDRVRQIFATALREGTKVDTEIRVRVSEGRHRWLWIRCAPNVRMEAQPRLTGLISDVTEEKSTEERLRESARLESVGVLAGGIAHDFNNLLTGILGNASLAMDDVGHAHSVFPFLESVVRASERAATLTNQMLAYSGRGRFIVRNIELSSLIREVSSLITASIPRHVTLTLSLQDSLPAIQADVTQMHQVAMNLIVNAAEAVPLGQQGKVEVTTRERILESQDLASLRNVFDAAPGSYVCLTVQDNGIGMNSRTQEKMFEPFFSTKFTGRGLGLAAVLGIIRSHKGAVGMESQLGIGTKITVYFPIAQQAEISVQPESVPTAEPLAQGTVLVIDDEDTVRTVARAMLGRAGFSVLTANDGAQGVRLFQQYHRSIIAVLLDLSMPVMDGEAALPLLRQIDSDIPIVLSTGYSEMEAANRFSAAHLAGVLQKPYTAAQFMTVLRVALSQKQGA
jgi:PAS domain S-box-containing protein